MIFFEAIFDEKLRFALLASLHSATLNQFQMTNNLATFFTFVRNFVILLNVGHIFRNRNGTFLHKLTVGDVVSNIWGNNSLFMWGVVKGNEALLWWG
jgi:hypothetical protein